MLMWTILAIVLIGGILALWVLNAVRLAKKNKNWERRSPKTIGRGGPHVDDSNRTIPDS